jgi:ornithine cyclodeaminase/alanine dehydrogenase-like protein (mu-crystallin family)
MKTLILSKKDISSIINMKKCIELCERAFVLTTEGGVTNYPRTWLESSYGGLLGAAYLEGEDYLTLKLLTKGTEIILIVDYKEGISVLMEGGLITDLRTGAGGAISARYLAKEGAENVGVLGSGRVATYALQALCEELELNEVKVYSRTQANREKYAETMSKTLGINVVAVPNSKEAVKDMDIIVTATKAVESILMDKEVSEGAHICALGNPPEIDPKLFLRSKVYLELNSQSKREGKLSNAIRAGVISDDTVFPELGEVILGRIEGRTDPRDITLFDSQGLIAQDAVSAWEAYSELKKQGVGIWVDMDISNCDH